MFQVAAKSLDTWWHLMTNCSTGEIILHWKFDHRQSQGVFPTVLAAVNWMTSAIVCWDVSSMIKVCNTVRTKIAFNLLMTQSNAVCVLYNNIPYTQDENQYSGNRAMHKLSWDVLYLTSLIHYMYWLHFGDDLQNQSLDRCKTHSLVSQSLGWYWQQKHQKISTTMHAHKWHSSASTDKMITSVNNRQPLLHCITQQRHYSDC